VRDDLHVSGAHLSMMPRPHALPRRKLANDPPVPVPAFEIRRPPDRPLASVNVQRQDQSIFDMLQSWWSLREGRSLQQCEAFTILLDVALRSEDARVKGLDLRVSDLD
jgi:hypothetical protein